MKKNNIKGIIIFSLALIIIFALATWLYAPVIFQEGNPVPYLKGAWQLNLNQKDIVKLDVDGDRYMTKNRNGLGAITELMKSQNYEFVEQLGAGYFYKSKDGKRITISRRYYSSYYSLWDFSKPETITEWLDYENKEYGFALQYPAKSIHGRFWTGLSDELTAEDVLISDRILVKNNNFYLNQQYSLELDSQCGKFIKKENTFIPEYDGKPGYGFPWHIVILDIKDRDELGKFIKQKYGSGCNYESRQKTDFADNYEIKIIGDGKDLGSTACPVNYEYYIRYSPTQRKVAFWHTGQECIIGLSFKNCFDKKISDSFHFTEKNFQVSLSTPTGIIKEQLDNKLE